MMMTIEDQRLRKVRKTDRRERERVRERERDNPNAMRCVLQKRCIRVQGWYRSDPGKTKGGKKPRLHV
jgi:hypothetical protein